VAFPVTLFPGDRFRNIDLIGNIRSPLLIIHGREDEVIPLAHGQTIHHQSAARHKELRIIDEAGHNDLFEIQGPEIIDAIATFARHAMAAE
jgi:pimeloyl-ACP methyl ester carboxylesterase